MPERSSDDVMACLRVDDPAADFRRFIGRLMALARLGLERGFRQRVDPGDALPSAYRCFFLRHAEVQSYPWGGR
jgi:hypothetical protein